MRLTLFFQQKNEIKKLLYYYYYYYYDYDYDYNKTVKERKAKKYNIAVIVIGECSNKPLKAVKHVQRRERTTTRMLVERERNADQDTERKTIRF